MVPLVSGSPRSQENAPAGFRRARAAGAAAPLRREPLRGPQGGIRLNEHIQHEDGEIVFRYACKLGLEGIASKRKDSTYRSGRSPDWLKMKNPGLLSVQKMQASISRECDLAHTSPPGSFLRPA